jgi:hypothetical protein
MRLLLAVLAPRDLRVLAVSPATAAAHCAKVREAGTATPTSIPATTTGGRLDTGKRAYKTAVGAEHGQRALSDRLGDGEGGRGETGSRLAMTKGRAPALEQCQAAVEEPHENSFARTIEHLAVFGVVPR